MLEKKTWNLLLPIYVDMDKSSLACRNMKREIPDILSKERFHGPKAILLPQASVSHQIHVLLLLTLLLTLLKFGKLFTSTSSFSMRTMWSMRIR